MGRVRTAVGAVIALATVLAVAGCGQDAADLPTAPLARADLVGTWASDGAGTIRFDRGGTVRLVGVPLRGITAQPDDPATPSTSTGRWHIEDGDGWGWKTVCWENRDADRCTAIVRGSAAHRQIDLVVGDPDQVDWYRYHRVSS